MSNKTCNKCKQNKLVSEFYWDSNNNSYLYICKSCHHLKMEDYFRTKKGKEAWNRASKSRKDRQDRKTNNVPIIFTSS